MDKDKIVLMLAKGLKSRGNDSSSDSSDSEESDEMDAAESAKDEAAQEIVDAIGSKDASALRAALEAFIEAC